MADAAQKSPEAYKTIREVADLLGVQPHVLRFWESRFAQVKPMKMRGSRRYYRPQDVQALQTIHQLLYAQGYTIEGAQKMLDEALTTPAPDAEEQRRSQLAVIRHELLALKETLKPFLAK